MIHNKKGFTLVELLIVIVIIAILATITFLSLAPAQKSARDARRIADVRTVQGLLQLYNNICGFFPNTASDSSGGRCGAMNGTLVYDGADGKVYSNTPAANSWSGSTAVDTQSLQGQLWSAGVLKTTVHLPDDPLFSGKNTYIYGTLDGSGYVVGTKLELSNTAIKGAPNAPVYGVSCNLGTATDPTPLFCVQF